MPPPDPVRERLEPFLADPSRVAVLTDFDGTLAPIVADPAAAEPLDGVPQVLAALAERYGRVAVVSGRPVSFLQSRVGEAAAGRLVLSGLYGLERVEAGRVVERPGVERWRSVVDAVASRAEQAAPPGILVERKGLSVTVHVRTAPEHAEWARSWTTAAANETGLALHDARMSHELRPPVDTDKGTIVRELLDGMGAGCFIGDDRGDLPAFDELDRAEADGAAVLRVAVGSPEAPPELIARADVVVDGPAGSLALLRRLLD